MGANILEDHNTTFSHPRFLQLPPPDYLHVGRDNAFHGLKFGCDRLRGSSRLFGPRRGAKSYTIDESPWPKFDLRYHNTVDLEERMYSKNHLREERMASLRQLLAELNSILTCSRRTLSKRERKSYTDAVLCLRAIKPALYRNEVRGASSRYDDFHAVHINQSFIIHVNVYLSTAHKDRSIWLIYPPGPILSMASMVHVEV